MVEEVQLEKTKYKKRQLFKTSEQGTWMLSIFLSILILFFGFIDILQHNQFTPDLTSLFFIQFTPRDNGGISNAFSMTLNDWIILSLMILYGLPSYLVYERQFRREKAIDKNLPFLLREIADAQKIGMSLPRAIREASKREYGPLTTELKKFAAKISWGIPFPQAMASFMESMNTQLSKQASILILEAERSGGNLERIFESAEHYVQENLNIRSEREGQIKPYMYIAYSAFFIFIGVIVILYQAFFLPFATNPLDIGIGGISGQITIPLGPMTQLFLWFVMVEAFFSGLVAGKMSSGTVKHGLIHSLVMMITGYIVFKAFIAQTLFTISF